MTARNKNGRNPILREGPPRITRGEFVGGLAATIGVSSLALVGVKIKDELSGSDSMASSAPPVEETPTPQLEEAVDGVEDTSTERESTPEILLGIDVSWPNEPRHLPDRSTVHVAIVGVNGGLPTTTSEYLIEQMEWAGTPQEIYGHPSVQLYCNTANPFDEEAYREGSRYHNWPLIEDNGHDVTNINPYFERTDTGEDESVIGWDGIVDYDDKGNVIAESASNNLSTCWKYGWDRAMGILADITKTLGEDMNLSEYKMWLDVETDNSWQSGSPEAQAKNVAVLEGMTACFNHTVGMEVGIYSARSLFNEIVGDQIRDDSNLTGLDTWLAMGDVSEERAKELLERGTLEGFTKGSQVVMLQTVIEDSNGVKLDYNYMLPK